MIVSQPWISSAPKTRKLRSRVVHPTFRLLLTLPSSSTLIFSLSYRLGRVPVSNTLITTVQQLVVWNLVLLEYSCTCWNVQFACCQRVEFNQTGIVSFDYSQIARLHLDSVFNCGYWKSPQPAWSRHASIRRFYKISIWKNHGWH